MSIDLHVCSGVHTRNTSKLKKKKKKGIVALTFNLSTWEAEADVSF